MGSINSEEIISILKTEIENYDMVSGEQEVGSVIWVGDGIATIYGIEHAMYGEIVIFENGIRGMVQDIRRDQIGLYHSWKRYRDQRGHKSNTHEEKSRCSGRKCLSRKNWSMRLAHRSMERARSRQMITAQLSRKHRVS